MLVSVLALCHLVDFASPGHKHTDVEIDFSVHSHKVPCFTILFAFQWDLSCCKAYITRLAKFKIHIICVQKREGWLWWHISMVVSHLPSVSFRHQVYYKTPIGLCVITDDWWLTLPGIVLQTAGLCSVPSLRVQPGPRAAGDPAQAPEPQHLCLEWVCPGRGPGLRQIYSACPLGTTLLSAVLGHTAPSHIPAWQGEEQL